MIKIPMMKILWKNLPINYMYVIKNYHSPEPDIVDTCYRKTIGSQLSFSQCTNSKYCNKSTSLTII
jgi:hypothetical protein